MCYDCFLKIDKGFVVEFDEDGEFIVNDVVGFYDYFLGMFFWNLMFEKVDELCVEKEVKEVEVVEFYKMMEKDLWMKDFDILE